MPPSSENPTSVTLLLRLRDLDDEEAWNEFVLRYTGHVFRWCRENGLQESDASDITQEVLTKLVMSMRNFEYDPRRGSFRGWLKTVTRNAVRDLGRRWRAGIGSGDTQLNRFLHEISEPDRLTTLAAEIESQYEFELLAEAESRVKLRVKPQTWSAYRMTAIDQQSSDEVARALGIPISAVYVAKSRVIKLLRDEVARLDPTAVKANDA